MFTPMVLWSSERPDIVVFELIGSDRSWRYLDCYTLGLLADGKRIFVPQARHQGQVERGYVIEIVSSYIPWKEALPLISATDVEYRICNDQSRFSEVFACQVQSVMKIAAGWRGQHLEKADSGKEKPLPASRPTPEEVASPAVKGGEPNGVSLRAGSQSFHVTWGETKDSLRKLAPGEWACSPDQGIDTCAVISGDTPLQADFGRSLGDKAIVALGFTPSGQFFRFLASFPEGNFPDIRSALIARLGPPTSHREGTVQNRFGANFDQEVLTWEGKDTRTELRRRSSDITTSALDSIFLPLAKNLPSPKPNAEAPF
jgi:hypothetical protein